MIAIAQRDVDQERPAPRQVGCQQAAEERPDGRHPADRRAPYRERDRPLSSAEQALTVDSVAGRIIAPPMPCRKLPKIRDAAARAVAATRLASHEPDRPTRNSAPAADHVSDAPERDQQRREHQRVDRVRPLGGRRRGVQVADDRRDRDVDDRRVDDDHRHAERDERHRQPAAAVCPSGAALAYAFTGGMMACSRYLSPRASSQG